MGAAQCQGIGAYVPDKLDRARLKEHHLFPTAYLATVGLSWTPIVKQPEPLVKV